MTKEDEEFLSRVAKEAPEVLKANIPEKAFDIVVKGLIDELPHPKQKRITAKRRKQTK